MTVKIECSNYIISLTIFFEYHLFTYVDAKKSCARVSTLCMYYTKKLGKFQVSQRNAVCQMKLIY